MNVKDQVVHRKIGAFELLIVIVLLEVIFGSGTRVFIYGALGVGFYFAKREFKGEFSLQDIIGLFTKANPKEEPK